MAPTYSTATGLGLPRARSGSELGAVVEIGPRRSPLGDLLRDLLVLARQLHEAVPSPPLTVACWSRPSTNSHCSPSRGLRETSNKRVVNQLPVPNTHAKS